MMKDLASSTLKIEEVYDPEKNIQCLHGRRGGKPLFLGSALPPSKQHFGIQEGEKNSCLPAGCLQELGSYLKEENLPLLKEYVKTCLYSDLSMMTDTASLDAAQEYQTEQEA